MNLPGAGRWLAAGETDRRADDTGNVVNYEVIVLGVGAMGAAACWRLARRGVRVLGIEQNGVPNALGSSHGQTRMTRSAYCEHPDYVPLVRRANDLWRELEADSGIRVLHLDGALYLGAPESSLIADSRSAADKHAVPYEMLDRAELASQYPQFHLADNIVGLFEREAGYLRPELGIAALAEQALLHGAEIHGCETVLSWEEQSGSVTVRTDRGEYGADKIIVTAGAWSSRLLADLGVKLTVTRQAMGWVWPCKPELFARDRFPVWAYGHGDGITQYGFPLLPDLPGMKIALHRPGVKADPDKLERRPLPGDEDTFLPFLQETIPDAAGSVLAIRICMYVHSPDSHFIIDRMPGSARVVVACGFSGHGFKFAPAIGEALADLAVDGRTELPIGFLGLHRFLN